MAGGCAVKLAIVSPYPPRFLAFGNYARAFLPYLRTCGFDQVVVLADAATRAQRLRGGIDIKPAWNPDSPSVLNEMVRAVDAEKPQVVWFNSGLMLGPHPLANLARGMAPTFVRKRGIPTVVTLHNLIEGGPLGPLGAGSSPAHRLAGRLATRLQLNADRVCLTLRRYVDIVQATYGVSNLTYVPLHVYRGARDMPVRTGAPRLLVFGS